jgi:hypothetical protein
MHNRELRRCNWHNNKMPVFTFWTDKEFTTHTHTHRDTTHTILLSYSCAKNHAKFGGIKEWSIYYTHWFCWSDTYKGHSRDNLPLPCSVWMLSWGEVHSHVWWLLLLVSWSLRLGYHQNTYLYSLHVTSFLAHGGWFPNTNVLREVTWKLSFSDLALEIPPHHFCHSGVHSVSWGRKHRLVWVFFFLWYWDFNSGPYAC